MAAHSAGEVSGPVATMTLSHSAGGRPAILAALDGDERMGAQRAVTSAEKRSRSTASAPPAGSLWASPARHDQRARAPHLLVQQADGVGLRQSSERNELEQTSSAKAVGLVRLGLLHRAASRAARRGRRRAAICQAASEPARPPPMTWIGCFCVMAADARGKRRAPQCRRWPTPLPRRKAAEMPSLSCLPSAAIVRSLVLRRGAPLHVALCEASRP